jgi:hypothetical protein
MPAIILAKHGAVVQRFALIKERTTIGRRTYNDIVIDEPGVSAEHAVLVLALGDWYFQDMGSTNGSRVNGQPVQKHFLQDGDMIELGQHVLQYQAHDEPHPFQQDPPGTAVDLSDMAPPFLDSDHRSVLDSFAAIEILNGHYVGKRMVLTQALTTIGTPAIQIAVFARGHSAYSLSHVEGDVYPAVNGKSIGMATQTLSDGDLIVLAGVHIRFLFDAVGRNC